MTMSPSLLVTSGSYVCLAGICWVTLKLLIQFLRWYFSPLHKIPGPLERSFLWGSFPEIRKEPFMQPHKRWWKDAGSDAKLLHYTSLLGRPSILVLDKAIVRTILSAPAGKSQPRFRKQEVQFLRNTVGDGLVTLDGEDWMRHRRILQPSFHTSFLKERLNEVVPPKVGQLIDSWQRAADNAREIDTASHLSALTLDIIGEVGFSHEFHGLDVVDEWSKADDDGTRLAELDDPFISSLLKALKINLMTLFFAVLNLSTMDRFFNPTVRHTRRILDQAVDQLIANAEKDGTNNSKSLLHLMLVAQDPEQESAKGCSLTKVEIRDESKTFLMAGHETTSTWVYWAMFALAKYPDVQDRLYKNIVKYAPSTSSDIGLEDVEKMDYLNAFLQEVLRLYPPVGMIMRMNTFPEILAGYQVPAETRIVISSHLLHRHPLYWDDPETFRPERWLNVTDEEWERRRFAFLPFSAGGRNCIGQRFATIEAQLIVAPLVRAFRIEIAPSQRETNFTFTTFVTMKTKPSLKILVTKRKESN